MHGCHETVAGTQLKSTIFFKKLKMTQKTFQLTKHGRSRVIWFVALNSFCTLINTFEKALPKFNKR